MPGFNSKISYDSANDMTLIIWTNLTVSLDDQQTAKYALGEDARSDLRGVAAAVNAGLSARVQFRRNHRINLSRAKTERSRERLHLDNGEKRFKSHDCEILGC